MKISLRKASKTDLPTIMEILNHAILNTTAVYSYELYTAEQMEAWFDEKINHNFPIIVSTKGNQVTGFVTYGKFRMRPAYKYTVEHSIYVHHDFRQQGVANNLMKRIIEEAIAADVHTLLGGIDAENEISIQFHEKFGFKKVAHIKEAGFKFNRWLDLVFMQLILETPNNPNEQS
jgi:phosphinothricin acetyltransferase